MVFLIEFLENWIVWVLFVINGYCCIRIKLVLELLVFISVLFYFFGF